MLQVRSLRLLADKLAAAKSLHYWLTKAREIPRDLGAPNKLELIRLIQSESKRIKEMQKEFDRQALLVLSSTENLTLKVIARDIGLKP
jgi:hypothetical protein